MFCTTNGNLHRHSCPSLKSWQTVLVSRDHQKITIPLKVQLALKRGSLSNMQFNFSFQVEHNHVEVVTKTKQIFSKVDNMPGQLAAAPNLSHPKCYPPETRPPWLLHSKWGKAKIRVNTWWNILSLSVRLVRIHLTSTLNSGCPLPIHCTHTKPAGFSEWLLLFWA